MTRICITRSHWVNKRGMVWVGGTKIIRSAVYDNMISMINEAWKYVKYHIITSTMNKSQPAHNSFKINSFS